jgi:hypothetical protein
MGSQGGLEDSLSLDLIWNVLLQCGSTITVSDGIQLHRFRSSVVPCVADID